MTVTGLDVGVAAGRVSPAAVARVRRFDAMRVVGAWCRVAAAPVIAAVLAGPRSTLGADARPAVLRGRWLPLAAAVAPGAVTPFF